MTNELKTTAQPAGEYPPLPAGTSPCMFNLSSDTLRVFTAEEMHAYYDLGRAAGSQAAPAAVAGPSDASLKRLREWEAQGELLERVWGTLVEQEREIERLKAELAAAPQPPAVAEAAPTDDGFWPVDESASRKQLIHQIGQMNYRLTALREENAGLLRRVHGQAESLRNHQNVKPPAVAQEPVAWCSERDIQWLSERSRTATITTTLGAAKSFERQTPLHIHSAPQQAASAHGDAEDAARYRWLRDKADHARLPQGSPQVCLTDEWGAIISLGKEAYPQGTALDTAIDAARSQAREGK